jgi:hypothetical protein
MTNQEINVKLLEDEIRFIYFELKKLDLNEKSNVASILECFNTIKEYLCRASEMKSEAEDFLLCAKLIYRDKETDFQAEKGDIRQYNYKDLKNIYCKIEENKLEKMEYLNKRLDRLRDDIKNIMMQLNVLQSYYKAEVKAGLSD